MSSIKAIFFDVGATLLTPALDEGIVFSEILNKHNLPFTPEEITPLIPAMYGLYEQLYEQDESFWSDDVRAQAIWIEMYEYLSSLLGVAPELRRPIAKDVYEYYFSYQAWKTFDDVIPLLDELTAQGYRLGLISNWDSTLGPIIEGLHLSHYFETILASAVVQLHKPMPEIFKLALARLDIEAHEAMHIGDHATADVWGAAQVGITPVLLDRMNFHENHEGLRVASLSQIPALLS